MVAYLFPLSKGLGVWTIVVRMRRHQEKKMPEKWQVREQKSIHMTWEGGSLVGPHSQPGLQNLSDFVENLQKLADLARFDFRIWSTFAINCQILQSFFIKCQKIYQILNFADSVPPEFPRPTTKKGLQKKGNW
jgi:hypothetical protein